MKNTVIHWEGQEKRTAERYRGMRSPGSGSGRRRPNDVRTEQLLIENKGTAKKQITIKAESLERLRRNATIEGRVPLLQFDLGGRSYVALLEGDFLDLTGLDE